MKFLPLIFFAFTFNLSLGQSIPKTLTYYSQNENGSVGKDKNTFSLANNYIIIQDDYYNTQFKFGPLILANTGFGEDGYYFELYSTDIKSDPLRFSRSKEIYSYKIAYTRKGGEILAITQAKSSNNRFSFKYFYTNKGYSTLFSQSDNINNSSQLQENSFDIDDVVINSSSLTQIMSKINFSFEQYGDKEVSSDGNHVTVRYKNGSLINPLITYTRSGTVTQIIFMMPINNSNKIGRELIRRYGTTYKEGVEVIEKGELTYNLRSQNDIGIVVIY